MTHPFVVTQAELDAFNKPMQETAKRLHTNDQPRTRSTGEIQADIDRLVSRLHDAERMLSRFAAEKLSLTEQLQRYKLAAAYWSDPNEKHNAIEARNALQELNGGNYYSKAYDRVEHRDGLIETTEKRLAELNRLTETWSGAVETAEKRLKQLEPGLRKELSEAKRREHAGRFR
jgi:chromosome segregation ATPase